MDMQVDTVDERGADIHGIGIVATKTKTGDTTNGHGHASSRTKRNNSRYQRTQTATTRRALMRTSLVTWIGMALHNLPEGASVYLSTRKSVSTGVSIAVAMMLHNVR
ncbi:hypothetical protein HDU93_003902, partial [Gonapodya sp. JEL0774]